MCNTPNIFLSMIAAFAMSASAHAHAIEHTEETPPTVTQALFDTVSEDVGDRLGAVVTALTTPFITFKFTERDQECLARNIFYEAANEPEEGKVAVGMVTINRVRSGQFEKTICGVVNQRTVRVKTHEVTHTETVDRGWWRRPETVTKKQTIVTTVPICQFSWVCALVRVPKISDSRWEDSQRIARALLNGEYTQWGAKYEKAMYFHATSIRPAWASQKPLLTRIGGHVFYAERI
jgi:spore germination cell wall hydrolase CwlJ-like protein